MSSNPQNTTTKSQDPKVQAHLARVRDNQRRSRARRKAYLNELEDKFRRCEQLGVQASAEMQVAARKVLDENVKLKRALLNRGLTEAELNAIMGEDDTEIQAQSSRKQHSFATDATRNLEQMLASPMTYCTPADGPSGMSPITTPALVSISSGDGRQPIYQRLGGSKDFQAIGGHNQTTAGGETAPSSIMPHRNTRAGFSTPDTSASTTDPWTESLFAGVGSQQQYQRPGLDQSDGASFSSSSWEHHGPAPLTEQAFSQSATHVQHPVQSRSSTYTSQSASHTHTQQSTESMRSGSVGTAANTSSPMQAPQSITMAEPPTPNFFHDEALADIEDLLSLEMQEQLVRGLQSSSQAAEPQQPQNPRRRPPSEN